MKAIHKTLLLISFAGAVLAGTAANARAQLLIKNDDRPCKLSIDGKEVATIQASGVYSASVRPGEHLLEAVSLDGFYTIELTLKTTNAQQIIKLTLRPDRRRLVRGAYEGKLVVSLSEREYLWSDASCYKLDHDIGEIPGGTFLRVIDAGILKCPSSDYGGVKVEYKGHVGWISELSLAFSSATPEARKSLQADVDRQQLPLRIWAGHWEGEGSDKRYVEDSTTYTTIEVKLTIDIDEDGGCEAVSERTYMFYFHGGPPDPPEVSTRSGKCKITDERGLHILLSDFDDVTYKSNRNAEVMYHEGLRYIKINLAQR